MLPGAAMMSLKRGLMAKPVQREPADPDARLGVDRGKLRHGVSARFVELPDLFAVDAGDQAWMVVALPPLFAGVRVLAQTAMRDGIGIGRLPALDRLEKTAADRAVVRGEVSEPK